MSKRKILITAALPYANGAIHVGHLVEYLQADYWCRFQKMRGHDCVYVCGDDTHGTAIMIEAKKRKIDPADLIAAVKVEHERDFADFQIEFSHYSSTHAKENQKLCNYFYEKMIEKKILSEKSINQLYCTHDQMFLPDRFVKGTCPNCKSKDQYGDICDVCGRTYTPQELIDPACSVCGTRPVEKETHHVFFELAHEQEFLRELLPKILAKETRAKMMEWFDERLRPWDITRDAPYFGFEIPGRPQHYFYVWVDAPMCYIATFRELCEKTGRNFSEVWEDQNSQTEIYHFIGKDIVYFHTLFWPALLKTANFRQPTSVFVHGFLTVNGQKMSKSKGTQIQARQYLDKLDPAHLRYYFASKMSATVDDFDFQFDDFVAKVNSDLIGKIVNLGSRSAQLLHKNFSGQWDGIDPQGEGLLQKLQSEMNLFFELCEKREFSKAMTLIRDWTDQANKYFDEKSPWKMIKADAPAAHRVLGATVLLFRHIAICLKPVLPVVIQKVEKLFQEEPWTFEDTLAIHSKGALAPFEPLLTRVDLAVVKTLLSTEQLKVTPPTSP